MIGGKRLEDFDALDQVRGNHVQLDVAHVGFRRRHVDAIDRHVAQARFGAADLDVFAFAFVALQRNAGQAADGVGDIRIREAGDDSFGQHLHDVFGGGLDVDRFRLTLQPLRSHDDLIDLRSDLQYRIRAGLLPGLDHYRHV